MNFELIDEISTLDRSFEHIMRNNEIELGLHRRMPDANHGIATNLPAWERVAPPLDPLRMNVTRISGTALDAIPSKSPLPTEIPNSLYVSHRILESVRIKPRCRNDPPQHKRILF